MLRYDYPPPVLPCDIPLLERFESDVLPFTVKHGPEIGELAMRGDADACDVIRCQHMFVEGLPELRSANYWRLVSALKRYEERL